MGTWGSDNFDNDAAGDYLDSIIDWLVGNIEKCFEYGDAALLDECGEGKLVPSVDIITTLCERYDHPFTIDGDRVKQWKERYLLIYDEHIDDYLPKPGFKETRRNTIELTFNKLEEIARSWQIP